MFVEQPPGFEVKDRDGDELVMQLEKILYGIYLTLYVGDLLLASNNSDAMAMVK